jgi:uncharacterized protein (TIGR02172 family)
MMNITSTVNDDRLLIALAGRIDTNNAAQVEQDILALIAQNPGKTPAFDAAELEYISSAGLRVLMKVRKAAKVSVAVENVSPDVYEIFETTGFTEILEVKKALRKVSVEGCELLGQGGNGSVYRLDEDKIVKVYKPWMKLEEIQREQSFARTAFVNGVPSVIAYDVVQVGDCLGVVFELLKSDTLGHAIAAHPEKLEEYVDQYVALAKTLHSTHVAPGTFTELRQVLHGRVPKLAQWCSQEEMDLLDSLIDCIPDSDTLTHNDLHPGNIMIQDGELVLIDMPEVTIAPPICDLVSIFRDMISAPKSTPDAIESSVGMGVDLIQKTGYLFFMKYTGITDPKELEEYFKKLGLLYALNVVLIVGAGSARSLQMAPMIMDNLLRGVVIPNEQAIRYLYQTL